MTLPNEVFLSHSSHDARFVTRLAEAVRRHGIPAWYSRTNIVGAQQWHDEIGAALKRCDWFLLVLSPHSVDSMWVKREMMFALQQKRFADRIIPVLYQSCDVERLSWVLPSLQAVDFQQSFNDGYRNLLRTWGLGYQPPA
jgi:TIR domain